MALWTSPAASDQSPEPVVWTVDGDSDRAQWIKSNRIESQNRFLFTELPITTVNCSPTLKPKNSHSTGITSVTSFKPFVLKLQGTSMLQLYSLTWSDCHWLLNALLNFCICQMNSVNFGMAGQWRQHHKHCPDYYYYYYYWSTFCQIRKMCYAVIGMISNMTTWGSTLQQWLAHMFGKTTVSEIRNNICIHWISSTHFCFHIRLRHLVTPWF